MTELFDYEQIEAARVLFAHPATFMMGAVKMDGLPPADLPEVAFAGRSNVGKSSLINALVGQKYLARASNEPGRTREINFFLLDEKLRLVDLPGYGFAAVPVAIKRDWGKLIGGYLEARDCLRALVVIMDSRHPLTDLDEQMLDWAAAAGRPCHVMLTKSDKLSRGAAAATLLQVRKALAVRGQGFTAQLFSSHSGAGAEEARQQLSAALA